MEKASEKSGAFYAEGNYTVSSEMRRFFKSVLKKTQKNYGKSIVKIRISCYDVQEIELIHFLFAEEGCFTSFI